MSKSSPQLLRDPHVVPTRELLRQLLGPLDSAYDTFLQILKVCGVTFLPWRYYHDGKAWLAKGEYPFLSARGKSKIKPIFWLSLWEGFFKVSFFFTSSQFLPLQELPLADDLKQVIARTYQEHLEKRLIPLIFNIRNIAQLVDLQKIIEYKKQLA